MKVIYRISTHTTANSNYALHIPATNGKPLCRQGEDKSLLSYEYTFGKPTCQKCLRIFQRETGRTFAEYEAQERILDKIAKMPLVNEVRLY